MVKGMIMITMMIFVLTACSLPDSKEQLVEQLRQESAQSIEIHYHQYSIKSNDPLISSLLADFISNSTITKEAMEKPIFQLVVKNDRFTIFEEGIVHKDKQYRVDTAPLRSILAASFINMKDIHVPNRLGSKAVFLDTQVDFSLDSSTYDLLIQDLKSSQPLLNPPWISGIPYPNIRVTIGEHLIVTWLSPSIVGLRFSDNPIGWVQLPDSKWWAWLQDHHAEELKRNGLFRYQTVSMELPDGSYVEGKDSNHLDQLWRMLSSAIKQESIPASEVGSTLNVDSITFKDERQQVIIKVWGNDLIQYQGQFYYSKDMYQKVKNLITAG
ncbi:hypothetical protein [Paenibacillus sp. 1001270B_150601_E10]|uniref:hypothetical protein n=1 Tax=Paenibacillus sp. 1001270B_150601_E10 TaxID=2787079 RepID=UPI00189E408A|nr:hypothetical protein [Paenibacillus sp. 1001270B_150601_E10]